MKQHDAVIVRSRYWVGTWVKTIIFRESNSCYLVIVSRDNSPRILIQPEDYIWNYVDDHPYRSEWIVEGISVEAAKELVGEILL